MYPTYVKLKTVTDRVAYEEKADKREQKKTPFLRVYTARTKGRYAATPPSKEPQGALKALRK
jgi:hypothetical protein